MGRCHGMKLTMSTAQGWLGKQEWFDDCNVIALGMTYRRHSGGTAMELRHIPACCAIVVPCA